MFLLFTIFDYVIPSLIVPYSLQNSGVKYFGHKMLRQFQNFSACLGNTLAKKNCRRLSKNLYILLRQWLRHTSAFCKGLWYVFSWLRKLVQPKLYRLLVTQLNRWNRRQYFFQWSPCLGFFLCPCYGGRIHNPALEKPGTQNIAAKITKPKCENQSKQR